MDFIFFASLLLIALVFLYLGNKNESFLMFFMGTLLFLGATVLVPNGFDYKSGELTTIDANSGTITSIDYNFSRYTPENNQYVFYLSQIMPIMTLALFGFNLLFLYYQAT